MDKTAICPGTYDPITEGHKDIIFRSTTMFKKVIVAVSVNTRKKPFYTIEQRLDFAGRALKDFDNVEIMSFEGLLIDFAKKVQAEVIIKGLRAISDFENEFQMAQINKKLNPHIETIFLTTNPKYAYLSSSAVKEVAAFGGCISGLVPESIEEDIVKSFKENN